jgi:four helix bundle protein
VRAQPFGSLSAAKQLLVGTHDNGKVSGGGQKQQATGNRQQATGNELRRGGDIAERLLDLGARVLSLVRTLPRDIAGRHVGSQLVRCSTSGGANYEEARAAESRADFIHKLGIAAKELREAIYWLRLIQKAGMTTTNLDDLIQRTADLTAILVASSRTARRNSPPT